MKFKFSVVIIALSVLLTGCKGNGDKFIGEWTQDKPGHSDLIIKEKSDHDLDITSIYYYGSTPTENHSTAQVETDKKAMIVGGLISQSLVINDDGVLIYDGKTYRKK